MMRKLSRGLAKKLSIREIVEQEKGTNLTWHEVFVVI